MASAVLNKETKRCDGPRRDEHLSVFPSALGWMALVTAGDCVLRLSFGHASPREAVADVTPLGGRCDHAEFAELIDPSSKSCLLAEREAARAASNGINSLPARLQAYAEGAADNFLDVTLDFGPLTIFQQRVIDRCRRIPVGGTLSYGELAERCGYPRAARAVGNCMRTNPIPLIVPCHRVVGAGGEVKGYSASAGVRMKLRLLELEKNGLCS